MPAPTDEVLLCCDAAHRVCHPDFVRGVRAVNGAFVGRATELATARNVLRSLERGAGCAVFVTGAAGIGKTALLRQILDGGWSSFYGAAVEFGGTKPLHPWLDALTIRPPVPGGTPSPTVSTEELMELVTERLEGLALEEPVLVAIDDLQWADDATLVLLREVLRRTVDLPIAVLLASRPAPREGMLSVLRAHAAAQEVVEIPLEPLTPFESVELATALLGAPPALRMRDFIERSGGNPLFLGEAIRVLRKEGLLITGGGAVDVMAAEALPPDLRTAIIRHLNYLPAATRDTLRVASVLGTSFSPRPLADILRTTVASVWTQIAPALDFELLVDGDESTVRFRHPLIRDALYEQIPRAVRAALHLDAATVLRDRNAHPQDFAHHLLRTASDGYSSGIEMIREAAMELRDTAPAVAVQLLEKMLELLPEGDLRRTEAAAALIRPLARVGAPERAEDLARAVLADPLSGTWKRWAREGLWLALIRQGKFALYREELSAALLDSDVEEPERTWMKSWLAHSSLLAGDAATADRLCSEQLAARRGRDPDPVRVYNLATSAWVALFAGDVEVGVERATQAVEEYTRLSDHPQNVYIYLGVALLESDRLEDAMQTLNQGEQSDAKKGDRSVLPLYHALRTLVAYLHGDWDLAHAEHTACLETAADTPGSGAGLLIPLAVQARIAVHRAQFDLAEALLASGAEEIARRGPQSGADLLAWAQGLLQEALQGPAPALQALQRAWRLREPLGYFLSWRLIAPDLVRMMNGRPSAELAPVLRTVNGGAAAAPGIESARLTAIQCEALATGDGRELTRFLLDTRMPRPVSRALATESAAATTALEEEQVALLLDAADVYEDLGAVHDLARVRARLRELGVRRSRTKERKRPTTGWESLTPAEVDVVRLAARGLTNRQIAERLFISRYTIDSHLRRIFAKLSVSSRVELATVAAAHLAHQPAVFEERDLSQ